MIDSPTRRSPDPFGVGGFVFEAAGAWPGGVALVLFCLAAYLPGISLVPPLDGDEARYAESSREMLAADDWRCVVIPHIGGAPRLNKPPLVYWMQAASAYLLSGRDPDALSYPRALQHEALGEATITGSPPTRTMPFTGGIACYRLPSVLATMLAVLITWRIGLQMFAPTCAWLAAVLLAGCFLVVVDARLARTDQVLLAFTCAAQWALWHLWRGRGASTGWVLLFWLSLGLGMLAKGPVTPAVAALTATALCLAEGEWGLIRRLRIGFGLLVLAFVFVPPLLLAISAVGADALFSAIAQEAFGRGLSATGGRAGPPGYHVVLLPGLFWPGGLLVVPGFIYAWRRGIRWRSGVRGERRGETGEPNAGAAGAQRVLDAGRSPELFCLAWIVPAWLVLELIETKLPHYPLPLYPAIALICARAAWVGFSGNLPLQRSRAAILGDLGWLLIGLALLVGAPVALAVLGGVRLDAGVLLGLLATVLVSIVLATAGFSAVRRRRMVTGLLVATAACALGGRSLFQIVLPNLGAPWLSSTLVHYIASVDPTGERPLAAAGFARESLAFLTGGRVERIAPAELAHWLGEHPRGLAIVPADEGVLASLSTRVLTTVNGFDYVEGRQRSLLLIEQVSP